MSAGSVIHAAMFRNGIPGTVCREGWEPMVTPVTADVTCPDCRQRLDGGPRPPLTFDEFAEKSRSRRRRWHGPDTVPWGGADWSNAMCGEAGEAANVVKKLRRHETGTDGERDPNPDALVRALGHELADVIAYATLLADYYGIDLADSVAEKFNIVSEREGFPERLPRRVGV